MLQQYIKQTQMPVIATSHAAACASVTKQYNLDQVKGLIWFLNKCLQHNTCNRFNPLKTEICE